MNIITKTCLVCGKDYQSRIKSIRGRRNTKKVIRPMNCVTCSKRCSKVYRDIYKHIKNNPLRKGSVKREKSI